MCVDGVRRAKTCLESYLVRDTKGIKDFDRYINNKRKTKGSVDLLLNGAGDLVTKDTEKARVLTGFFTSVFTGKICLQESQVPKTEEVWRKKELALLKKDQVREYLNKQDLCKSMGPGGMNP